jgi:hypothetical protein
MTNECQELFDLTSLVKTKLEKLQETMEVIPKTLEIRAKIQKDLEEECYLPL